MDEQVVKLNRGWVKNVAIIFLSVLLVLTFFSNTIMNHSLPEVAAQYARSGSITSKIRLSAAAKATGLNTVIGTVASGDLFVSDPADKARIVAQFGASACEMEGAAIGQVAYTNGVPFAVLRAISDGGDGMEFSQFVALAAKASVKVTREFVKRFGN